MAVWRPSDSAPCDGSAFVGRFASRDGQPLVDQAVMVAARSEYEDGWVAARVETDEGSVFFDTTFAPGILTGWQPLPDLCALLHPGPPLTDQPVLADMGYPWPVVAHWDPAVGRFCYAELQGSWCQGKQDVYFECESMDPAPPCRWAMLPGPAFGHGDLMCQKQQ